MLINPSTLLSIETRDPVTPRQAGTSLERQSESTVGSLLLLLIRYSHKEQAQPVTLTNSGLLLGNGTKCCIQQVPLHNLTGVWIDYGNVAGLFFCPGIRMCTLSRLQQQNASAEYAPAFINTRQQHHVQQVVLRGTYE